MGKRVVAVAALGIAALVLTGAPAGAQTYPPPRNALTVDNPAPAPGQSVVVTLQTCKPSTVALFGIDLLLLGSARVGPDGVARATITIPNFEPPGRHKIVGVCIGSGGAPLVLTTSIRVGASPTGPVGGRAGQAGGGAALPPGGSGGSGGTGSGTPQLAGLGSGQVPADAASTFGQAGTSVGVTDGGTPVAGTPVGNAPAAVAATGGGSATTHAAKAKATGSDGGDSGPGTLASVARVLLGLAALGGVPVALALSHPSAAVRRRRFA